MPHLKTYLPFGRAWVGTELVKETIFCHCCDLKAENVILPNTLKCAHCVRFDNSNCFHHPVGDHAYMESVKIEWCSLLETHNHIFNSENVDKMTINAAPEDVFWNS